jgi:ribosomal-protein-alanine N-acetyltransferase
LKAPILHTEKLTLLPLDKSFASGKYVDWMNDPEVYTYLETGGNYTLEKLQEYLLATEEKDTLFWAITITDSGTHIGNIKIDPVNERHQLGEYAIMMGDRSAWGKGYAKEASEAVINYCFKTLQLRKITLGVVEDNINAVGLYQKLGFVTEGVYKKHGIYGGKYCNTLRMALFNPASTY